MGILNRLFRTSKQPGEKFAARASDDSPGRTPIQRLQALNTRLQDAEAQRKQPDVRAELLAATRKSGNRMMETFVNLEEHHPMLRQVSRDLATRELGLATDYANTLSFSGHVAGTIIGEMASLLKDQLERTRMPGDGAIPFHLPR